MRFYVWADIFSRGVNIQTRNRGKKQRDDQDAPYFSDHDAQIIVEEKRKKQKSMNDDGSVTL